MLRCSAERAGQQAPIGARPRKSEKRSRREVSAQQRNLCVQWRIDDDDDALWSCVEIG
jgi:hypothetical protein